MMSNSDYDSYSQQLSDKEDEEAGFDLKLWLVKIVIHWPWFVVSVIVCLLLGFVYARYKSAVYRVDAAVLITEDNRTRPRAGTIDLQNLGIMSMTNNFDNEIEILKSRSLIRKVVADLGLYIDVTRKRTFAAATPVYETCPVSIMLSPEAADTLSSGILIDMRCNVDRSVDLKVVYAYNHDKIKETHHLAELPAVLALPMCALQLDYNPERQELQKAADYKVVIVSLDDAATSYMNRMAVSPRSKTTTIAQIEFLDTHPRRGVDFLQGIVTQYNKDANDDKNQSAQKTADFIEERIALISKELGVSESKLAIFKQNAGLTNLVSDAQLALNENARIEKERMENATQISIIESLRTYVEDPANAEEIIPLNVGIQDQSLSALISQYNTLLLDYKRLQRSSNESNPALAVTRDRVAALHRSVVTSINTTLQNLRIAREDIARQGSKFQSRISQAPVQEKEYLSLSREQALMAQLYTLLLQKREENAITLAATANNGRLIENPIVSRRPIAPNRTKILLAAFLLGLLLPFLVLYVIELTKYKIEGPSDIEALTRVPLIAELPEMQTEPGAKNAIVVRENENTIAVEAFRALRTNLSFMIRSGQNVIMVSSTQPGEGKSFVAANTAMSLALLGKKVIVVGLDIRKPGLNRVFGYDRHRQGVSDYLRDPSGVRLDELIIHAASHPNLDVLLGGTVPPNPTELISSEALDQLIQTLRQTYDLVLIDTAPIGMVPDSAIVARVADICLYVCRADVTPKAGFSFVNRLAADHKFAQLAIVLNGIDLTKRKNNSAIARRYGYGYGYGSSYGYGYGYSMGQETSKK